MGNTKPHRASRLRQLRRRAGLTIYDVAEKLRLSPPSVSRMECGKVGMSVATARRLAGLYGVTVDDIVGGPLKRPRAA
jgi:transcriptional regulator with XRE-family HTH domain